MTDTVIAIQTVIEIVTRKVYERTRLKRPFVHLLQSINDMIYV